MGFKGLETISDDLVARLDGPGESTGFHGASDVQTCHGHRIVQVTRNRWQIDRGHRKPRNPKLSQAANICYRLMKRKNAFIKNVSVYKLPGIPVY